MKITREDIMNFFRNDNDDCDNLNSLSNDDRYELIWHLGSHSSYLEEKFNQAIENYENGEEENG